MSYHISFSHHHHKSTKISPPFNLLLPPPPPPHCSSATSTPVSGRSLSGPEMAYAAVNSLYYTIKGLVHNTRISLPTSTRQSLLDAYDDARSLRRMLGCCSEGVMPSHEQIIIEEARKLEDAIEFNVSTHFLDQGSGYNPSLTQDLDSFAETAQKMEESIDQVWQQKVAQMIQECIVGLFLPKTEDQLEYDDGEEEGVSSMIGLSDQFLQIRDALVKPYFRRRISPPKIIGWISGMAGIGKTTIAKRIFNDPSVKERFECRAFVTVGLELQLDQVLQSITSQINLDYEEIIVEGDEEDDLYERFIRILSARKSLIVLDDVWVEEWEAIIGKRFIIEDPGSRILVTSRTDAFSTSHFCSVKIRFMNEEESWELLKMNVFDDKDGEERPSPQLVKAGKKIAHKCEGLPLLIIAVANQIKSNVEDWNRVAEKPNPVLEAASHQISEVLLSSYHRISEEEKLRFLYIAAFPLNYIVLHSTIVNLWCVEGFIAPWDISFVNNFHLLLEKNLVVGHQKSWTSGETKACSLHSAYWFLSKRVANDNRILYIIKSCADGLDECVESHRRLAISENVLLAIKEVHNKIASISTVRSLLCTGPYHRYEVPLCLEWKLLKILDALTIRFYDFPVEVVRLTRLRYLALTSNANLPPSISKLRSLEFLMVHQHSSIKRSLEADDHEAYVPVEIWELQELEHLEITGRNLPDPPHPGVVLPGLKKLLDVGAESCTRRVLESFPRLEKLRIQIDPDAAGILSCLDDISCFYLLKSFQCVIMNPLLLPAPPLSIFPSLILKLSLSGFGYPWEDMYNIAELPNLKVLKLKCYAFQGEKWEAEEMRFPELGHLFIEDTDLVQWTAGDQTFKWLTRLTIRNCYNLEEIPRLPEDVDIELVDCSPVAESCAKQWNYYVNASYSWNEKKLKP